MNSGEDVIKIKNFIKRLSTKAEDLSRDIPFKCLYPGCSAMPVGCHSQQCNGALSAIANASGKVIVPSKDAKGDICRMLDGAKVARGFYPENIREATRFKGFCQKHDSALFSSIEKRPLVVDNDEQVLAFQRRAVALELRGCIELLAGNKIKKEMSERRNLFLKSNDEEIFWAEERLKAVACYDWMPLWRDKTCDQIHHVWRVLPKKLQVSLASIITPAIDNYIYIKYWKALASVGMDIIPRLGFTLTIVPQESKTHVIMAWNKFFESVVLPYRNRLMSSNNSEVEEFLNECVFCLSEDWCMNPAMWDGIPQSVKDELQLKLSMESYHDRARNIPRVITL